MISHDTKIIHISDPQSPYLDRGFLYGESIYDVIPFYDKKPYSLHEHYQKFHRDLSLMKIAFTLNFEEFSTLVLKTITKTDYPDGAIYVQVSSGNEGTRSAMPTNNSSSSLVIYTFEYPRPQMASLMAGIKLALYPDNRGAYCYVKSNNRLSTRLAMLHAKEQGATEAILHHPQNKIIHEGCSSNIFFINDHQLITPSLSPHIYPGLAREHILNLADDMNVKCTCRDIHIDEIRGFQGAFITGSVKQLMPVRQLDQQYYSVHPLWGALFKAYNKQIDHALKL